MSWDHANDALERLAEAQRWDASGWPAGSGPLTDAWRAAELRRAEEDHWLAEQRELTDPDLLWMETENIGGGWPWWLAPLLVALAVGLGGLLLAAPL